MVAGADVIHLPIPAVLDVQYQCSLDAADFHKVDDMVDLSSPPTPILASHHPETAAETSLTTVLPSEPALMCFVPIIRSGSHSDIGPRSYMEDEHLRIDHLSAHLGSLMQFPSPCSFYGVFDGHGGPEAAAFVRQNAIRLFFEDADFPRALQVDDIFLAELEESVRKSFLVADLALADDSTINASSGTTALTALIFGRHLLVANAGDCRAVLCRKGEAVDMSQDHRPNYDAELRRIEEAGGFVEDGYLNGVLSVARALGDWDLKLPRGSNSPLIAEPEFRQAYLTEDDEFLIIGCDGIWDVMSSQEAVGVVRRGLRRHDDPAQCARELVMEALRLKTADNLTVIVVCFSSDVVESDRFSERRGSSRLRCCALSSEALCRLKSLLEDDEWRA